MASELVIQAERQAATLEELREANGCLEAERKEAAEEIERCA